MRLCFLGEHRRSFTDREVCQPLSIRRIGGKSTGCGAHGCRFTLLCWSAATIMWLCANIGGEILCVNIPSPEPSLEERLRGAIRLKKCRMRAEEGYVQGYKRDVLFQPHMTGRMKHPQEMGAAEVTAFLTNRAANKNLAAASHNLRGSIKQLGLCGRQKHPRRTEFDASRAHGSDHLLTRSNKHRPIHPARS